MRQRLRSLKLKRELNQVSYLRKKVVALAMAKGLQKRLSAKELDMLTQKKEEIDKNVKRVVNEAIEFQNQLSELQNIFKILWGGGQIYIRTAGRGSPVAGAFLSCRFILCLVRYDSTGGVFSSRGVPRDSGGGRAKPTNRGRC